MNITEVLASNDGFVQMATKQAIKTRRENIEKMLQDGVPVSVISDVLQVTCQTIYRDWALLQKKWMEENLVDEEIPPHTIYRLALCTKIDLLTRLQYDQKTIGRLLSISQSHVSKLKRWSENHGIYSNSAIRVLCCNGIRANNGREVRPGCYAMYSMNQRNVWLRCNDVIYTLECDKLVNRHELVSVYLHDYDFHLAA